MSYIKNGWENNFTDSWKHLASDVKSNVDVSSSSTSSPNTLHEFPQAANWCSIQRAEFPPFTIENMMNYFIKRKSGDNEGNKDLACSRLSVVGEERKRARKNEGGLRRGAAEEPVRLSLTTLFWYSRSYYTLWLVNFESRNLAIKLLENGIARW